MSPETGFKVQGAWSPIPRGHLLLQGPPGGGGATALEPAVPQRLGGRESSPWIFEEDSLEDEVTRVRRELEEEAGLQPQGEDGRDHGGRGGAMEGWVARDPGRGGGGGGGLS